MKHITPDQVHKLLNPLPGIRVKLFNVTKQVPVLSFTTQPCTVDGEYIATDEQGYDGSYRVNPAVYDDVEGTLILLDCNDEPSIHVFKVTVNVVI
jgi:hypothetical protein